MPTYIVKKEIAIMRQEGDTGDVEFTVPEMLDMSRFDCRFQVSDVSRGILLAKNSTNGSIILFGQKITIPLQVADTKNKAGKYRWEMELFNEQEVITIGKGDFVIIKELLK